MGLLDGKRAMVFGVANDHSIAWGIAQALQREGAQVGLSYAVPALERRATKLAEQIGAPLVVACDVSDDAQIEAAMAAAGEVFGELDIVVHSIGFAPRAALQGPYYNTSRADFATAMAISCYSFTALVRAARPYMGAGGSFLTMTAEAGARVIPEYNVMALAKAALEASVRYLAYDLGPEGLRVNAISAGPVRTLAAAGVGSFKRLYPSLREMAPLRRNIDIHDVGDMAVFLSSELARNVTGQVVFVDAGVSVVGVAPE